AKNPKLLHQQNKENQTPLMLPASKGLISSVLLLVNPCMQIDKSHYLVLRAFILKNSQEERIKAIKTRMAKEGARLLLQEIHETLCHVSNKQQYHYTCAMIWQERFSRMIKKAGLEVSLITILKKLWPHLAHLHVRC